MNEQSFLHLKVSWSSKMIANFELREKHLDGYFVNGFNLWEN